MFRSLIRLEVGESGGIFEKHPGWIMRYGIILYFLIFLALLVGSLFFSYPEVVKGKIEIVEEKGGTGLTGNLLLPVVNSGVLKAGQTVNIKLYNYPYQQYGFLVAHIDTIQYIALDNCYMVKVKLPGRLISSYQKTLPFMPGLSGTGEVMIRNSSLFRRIFSFKDENP